MTPNKKIAFLLERAHLLLKEYYGYESFLPLQKNIISDILNGRDTLAIMQTGAGKSICFHIPALLFDGITIIILPHNYTIRQKTDELTKKGIPVDYISADAKEIEIATTIKKIHQKYTKILYLAVEQLDLCLKIKIFENIDISLLIVDEAHCISPYGHDYKPTYQVIRKFIDCLPERPRLSAFSTTVATNIQKDIIKSLALGRTAIHISTFINENLFLDIKKEVKKNLFLQIYLKKNITKSGIIYASTPSIVENIYNFLKKKDFSIGLYHNDLTAKEQQKIQEDFLSNKINILVTTNTFFINPQKENIRYIIHYNIPKTLDEYCREIANIGTDGKKTEAILLFSMREINEYKKLLKTSNASYEQKTYAYQQLKQILAYCQTSQCLHKFILEYLGKITQTSKCHNCINCHENIYFVNITIIAQKILSCVYRMNESYSIPLTIKVLRGEKNSLISSLKLDTISTYGIMKEYSQKEIENYIKYLISMGQLTISDDTNSPTLKLNKTSYEILRGNHIVNMSLQSNNTNNSSPKTSLFDILRAKRKELAFEENLPAYMILSDTILQEIANKKPLQQDDLRAISGITETKLKKYGKAFLAVVKAIEHYSL